jgi:hypothetical protein
MVSTAVTLTAFGGFRLLLCEVWNRVKHRMKDGKVYLTPVITKDALMAAPGLKLIAIPPPGSLFTSN